MKDGRVVSMHPGERGWRCRDCADHMGPDCIYAPEGGIAYYEAACWWFRRSAASREGFDVGTMSVELGKAGAR